MMTLKLPALTALLLLLPALARAQLDLSLDLLASGFSDPIHVTHAGDATGRLFVAQQRGRIRIVTRAGAILTPDFLDLGATGLDRVSRSGSERGLLGLAFHPDYPYNGRFFVNYTDRTSGDTLIEEFRVSAADPNAADPASGRIILGPIDQPESNHNGGVITFGPDGYLYIGTGDGGGGGDRHGTIGNGQSLDTLLGKILRIGVDRTDPGLAYAIPASNPFRENSAALDEIYAYGLRNPWRFSFDRATGRLFCADVGQNELEEVNIIDPGGNYGWRIMEADACYNPSSGCDQTGLILPIGQYSHALGCSVTGGYVYRGIAFPALQSLYLFGDYCSGRIWSLQETSPGNWSQTQRLDSSEQIVSFGEDESGELYLCDLGGQLFRVVDDGPASASPTVAVTPRRPRLLRFKPPHLPRLHRPPAPRHHRQPGCRSALLHWPRRRHRRARLAILHRQQPRHLHPARPRRDAPGRRRLRCPQRRLPRRTVCHPRHHHQRPRHPHRQPPPRRRLPPRRARQLRGALIGDESKG